MLDKVPEIRKPAPVFKGTAVVNSEIQHISLANYFGKYVVLLFYSYDFSLICPTEILAFSDNFDEFRKLDTNIIACSTDSESSHLEWIKKPKKDGGLGPINFPLLADNDRTICKMYGILEETEGVAYRGLFIIDNRGILRNITINDVNVGRSVFEVIRLIQAFQFSDENGELCPANWSPGKKSVKIDPNMVQVKRFNSD